jgi:AraC-like DNA-binding protein
MSDKYEVGTAANHYISQLYHEALRNNLNAEALLEKIDLSTDVIDKPNCRVKTEKLSALQSLIWQALQDESMGLATSPLPHGSYFMMGRLTVNQPNLQKALELGAKFYAMLSKAFSLSLNINGDNAFLNFELASPEHDPQHMFSEILLLAAHRFASWLIADSLPLTETHFNYSTPAHIAEYSYLFPGKHIFDSNKLGFAFPSQYLQREIQQSDVSLAFFMQRCPQEIFQRYEANYSLSSEIKRLIRKNLPQGIPSIERAAATMYLTKKTLMRKLKAEGTSYQALKDVVRRDKAVSLLTKHNMTINQISEVLGFSDQAVFTRAFLNWMGVSPSHYRKQNKVTA